MNANTIKTQIWHKMKYDLKGHLRSQKVILKFLNYKLVLRAVGQLLSLFYKYGFLD